MCVCVCVCVCLTVSIPKTKRMVTGRLAEESDGEPIAVSGGNVSAVEEFPYLGLLMASSGRMDVDVDRRVAQRQGPLVH